jgi:small nuclear ribonucleoprotein (snRNP)-like protein
VTLLAVALLVSTVIVLTLGRYWTTNRIMRLRHRRTVIVTLKSGHSFRGVLFDSDLAALALRNAEALGAGTSAGPVPVDGEVVILSSEVEFIQRP